MKTGTGKYSGRTTLDLVHRVAYITTRGRIPLGARILHLCHRRSCIQPSHLYAGTAQDNQKDKEARFSEHVPRLPIHRVFEKYDPLVKDGMKHFWDEPAQIQPSFIPPEHKCIYTIPAGIIDLCHICFKPKPHQLSDLQAPDFLKIEAQHRADIRAGLDECCVGRGPQSPPHRLCAKVHENCRRTNTYPTRTHSVLEQPSPAHYPPPRTLLYTLTPQIKSRHVP